ncbi:EAL domain-containing protein, partial [Actinotalea sp. C106]|uniref:EAL domain-containing protein n=1 Tax=Actinotalea sp. C106 TaxID=2908644 RepID=UPI0020280876
ASDLAGGVMGLLAAADAALYRAKAGGRGRTEVYDPSMSMAGAVRHGAAAELGQAIDAGQLVLHFQPVVDLEDGLVVGHEALVRWQHPERGLLLPGTFLATADEAGLSVALGLDVARQAVAHLAATADRGHWVSINASAEQLADGELTGVVLAELARLGVAPGRLVVELTEASLVDAGTRIRHELSLLGQGGVPVLLDDFGTGVAPLSYLRDLPVTGVKLDMSFTAGIPEDPAAARVSRALGALAREMEMVTVAEGIETPEQAEFLRGCGWRYGQGWLFGAGRSEPVVGVTDGRAP